ncbi:hypothetical protein JHK84_039940 [Glycine max]|uniref:Uncharacterized protein n=1 Tax=Glycine max TaxID=3847 RepID=A0A0R0GLW1_SOYBN|nr:hypothetical protein JHK84_039940 [Glycine max]
MFGNVLTSKQAWDTFKKMFASKTKAHIMYLKECLSCCSKETKTVFEYLYGIKSLSYELVIITSPFLDDDDPIIHTFNGPEPNYKEITTALCTRKNPIGYEELHDLLTNFESYLKHDESKQDSATVTTTYATHKVKSFF